MSLLYDMHVHSQSSHDSVAKVYDIAKFCIENGIKAFAITDHCDIQYYNPLIVESSINETKEAKKEFGDRVKILKGIEIGEVIWEKSCAEEILNKYDYDVVVSSVHAVRYKRYTEPYSTIDFSKMTEKELFEYLKTYFDEVLLMVSETNCDVMAHLTCPLRYIVGKYNLNVDMKKYELQIDKILDYVIKNGISMEINTSGIDTPFDSFMPDRWIIEKFVNKGGKLVTLGSDAHSPNNVAKGFEKADELLKSLGLTGYYYYENRKPIFVEF